MEIPPPITNITVVDDDEQNYFNDDDDNILSQQHDVKNSKNIIEPSAVTTTTTAQLNDNNNDSRRSPPRLYLLYGIIILQTVIFLSEMIIDQMVHSMLILADAYHHLFNSFNAILLVVCYKISNQITVKNTFGWVRTELLGMLTTITFIVALIFSLLIEGALQLLHLHEISGPTNPKILFIFGIWSLIVNILYVLTINGVMTDKKYKQTTQKERSFSTAKCQLRRLSSSSSSSKNRTELIAKSKSKSKNIRKKISKTSMMTTTTTSSFPRNKIEPDEDLDLITTDGNNDRTATMDPTSWMDEAYRVEFSPSSPAPPKSSSSETKSNCFCQSFVQGILSPCFVIFCSFLITLAQHGNTQGYWELTTVEMIDPLIGIITAISLCITFYPQLKNTFLILMQTIPEGVNIVQLKREILDRFQVIDNIHEFHIWLLNGSDIVVTCHIVLPPQNTAEYSRLFDEIKQFLQFKYGIRYITIQPEFTTKNDDHDNHHYHNYQIEREQRRHSSKHCNNQCLVKCPCDRNGDCEQCLIKSCCNIDTTIDSVVVIDHHHHHHQNRRQTSEKH
ncbi:uncharacterized protein LOC124498080 [Dermatophagoides farinae]|uniref:uncharacterized protein LOC124498080 n=1 Tax=Dermatophagoides farinae TaxID=6954 RepID=UPI003F63AED2